MDCFREGEEEEGKGVRRPGGSNDKKEVWEGIVLLRRPACWEVAFCVLNRR